MKIILMFVKLISLISYILADSKTYSRPTKKLLDEQELDMIIKLNLERARKNVFKIDYNLEMMDIAQYLVNQLASRGALELPYIRSCKKYVGYAYQYQGYIKSAKKFFGSKMCFNNILQYSDANTYDVLYDCTPKFIDVIDFDEYGYATAFDKDGNAYLIRLFTVSRFGSAPPNQIGHVFNPNVNNNTSINQTTSLATLAEISTTKSNDNNNKEESIKSSLNSLLKNLKKKSKKFKF